jgi:hypothetical protein
LSQTMGGVILGSGHALNLVVNRAGAPGDYLYRNFIADSPAFPPLPNNAMWGVFRVGPQATDVLALTAYDRDSGGSTLSGYVTPDLRTERYASQVELVGRPDRAPVDQATGRFQFALKDAPATVTARSPNGGEASATLPPSAPKAAVEIAKALPSGAEPEAIALARFPNGEASAALPPAVPAAGAEIAKPPASGAQPEAVAQAVQRYRLQNLGEKYMPRMVGRHAPAAVTPSGSQPITTGQATKSPP